MEYAGTALCGRCLWRGQGILFQWLGSSRSNRECRGNGTQNFGDVDPAGILIPLRFNETHGAVVRPAIDLYRFALDHGSRRSPVIRVSGDQEGAQRWLPELTDQICALWASDRWIPQESLGTEQLFSNWESDPGASVPRLDIC